MSLVRFKANNHRQQVARRGRDQLTDDRGTDPRWFEQWSATFGGFTLDVAAAPHNAKCEHYYTEDDNGLELPWTGRVWCNPPYSDIGAWVRKAWAEMEKPTPPELIVMLLPANRTEQRWWQEHVEPYRDESRGELRLRFLPGRLRFVKPGADSIGPNERPPFGCCLLIWSHPTARRGRTMSAVDGLKAEVQRLLDVNAQLHAELDGLRRELAGTREELEDALARDRTALELEALLAEAERALGLDRAAPIDRWMARGFGVYR